MTKRRWPVVVAPAADADFDGILRWTSERFGAEQALSYAGVLSAAINALAEGPGVAGAKSRDDIGVGCFALHVARAGRKGRHFVVFRIGQDEGDDVIEVLRLLHDAMDLRRHLTQDDVGET